MYNYKLTIIYHGKYFSGWQINKDFITVQWTIEKALKIINGYDVKITGASRTDSGVHSYGQIANCQLKKQWNCNQLKKAINFYLDKSKLLIDNVEMVNNNFHSRYSNKGKIYYYQIYLDEFINPFEKDFWWCWKKPIDINKLDIACQQIKNSKNLNGFAHNFSILKNFYNLEDLNYQLDNKKLILKFKGKGFFYNEIRFLVGHIIYYSSNLINQETFFLPLNNPNNNIYHKILAPAHGLFLMEVII
jgi:tRNA pseudouridine38-40 synthase